MTNTDGGQPTEVLLYFISFLRCWWNYAVCTGLELKLRHDVSEAEAKG